MSKLKTLNQIKNIKKDTFGFLLDKLINFIINSISPIPIPTIIISQLRAPIVGFLGSALLLFILFNIVTGTVLLSPLIFGFNAVEKITNIFNEANEFNIPIDTSFDDVKNPKQTPLGGDGMEYVSTTAGFMDPSYFLQFDKAHTGIDLVPNSSYYTNNELYKKNKIVVVYATHSGKTTTYIDNEGGKTVEILNPNGDLKTKYIHFKNIFAKTGDKVLAGSPLGEMGSTGFATGEHVHYEVQIKDEGIWKAVNPLKYIK